MVMDCKAKGLRYLRLIESVLQPACALLGTVSVISTTCNFSRMMMMMSFIEHAPRGPQARQLGQLLRAEEQTAV
jgi:hypothetical protein